MAMNLCSIQKTVFSMSITAEGKPDSFPVDSFSKVWISRALFSNTIWKHPILKNLSVLALLCNNQP